MKTTYHVEGKELKTYIAPHPVLSYGEQAEMLGVSRSAMHEDAPVQWTWHTGVLLFDGTNWHVVSPANYGAKEKRIIRNENLQAALDEFGKEEQYFWPSAAYIESKLLDYAPPFRERATTGKGFTVSYLNAQMYVRDGKAEQTRPARLLMGM